MGYVGFRFSHWNQQAEDYISFKVQVAKGNPPHTRQPPSLSSGAVQIASMTFPSY